MKGMVRRRWDETRSTPYMSMYAKELKNRRSVKIGYQDRARHGLRWDGREYQTRQARKLTSSPGPSMNGSHMPPVAPLHSRQAERMHGRNLTRYTFSPCWYGPGQAKSIWIICRPCRWDNLLWFCPWASMGRIKDHVMN